MTDDGMAAAGMGAYELARRQDLSEAMGFVVSVPWHGRSRDGIWQYGRQTPDGMANDELTDQFHAVVRDITVSSAQALVPSVGLAPDEADAIPSHVYSTGPAAQEWPQYFFELYRNARPLLDDGAALLAWAYFFKDVWRRLREWENQTAEEVHSKRERSEIPAYMEFVPISARPAFTLPALISLCYGHAVTYYGLGGKVTIDALPRSNFVGYAGVDHPAGSETYLIRLRSGDKDFYYLLSGHAEEYEHYLLVGRELTLLPLPDFFDEGKYTYRQAEPPHRIRVKPPMR